MSRTWNFTPIEFFALWEVMDEGFLPAPLSFLGGPPLYHDLLRELRECRERLAGSLAGSFDGVLDVVAQPDIRIVVRGQDGKDSHDPAGCVRMLIVRRGDQAYLVKQLPGETIWHSGGVVVSQCNALRLADPLVAELPTTNAGRQPDIVLPASNSDEGVDYSYGRSQVLNSSRVTATSRSTQFMAAPATSIGTIEIMQGRSKFGPRGVTRHQLGWRDLAGDGRYVIADGNPPVATAANDNTLVATIDSRILAIIRAIKDER